MPPSKKKRLVWRMTERAPKGEWVDPDAPSDPSQQRDLPEVSSGGWIMSSFDLLSGAEVRECSDAVPDDIFDELFPPKKDAPKTTSR